MRYKDYVWPHNPRVYSIDYERKMAVNKVPFGTYHLQDLGRTRRVELRLEQEPRPDYVRYSFAFWEASGLYSGAVQEVTRTGEAASGGNGGVLSHTVEQGDTLWAISARYGVGMTELLARNPQIRNPNLILPGEKVTVR